MEGGPGGQLGRPPPLAFPDPRTDSWFLVRSPLPVTLLLAVYLLLVVAGPRLMSSHEPLSLAGPLAAYNLGLVVLSGYMFYEVRLVGDPAVLGSLPWGCQGINKTMIFPCRQLRSLDGARGAGILGYLWLPCLHLLFSCSVVSNSWRPHGLQHPRLLCLPLSPRACSHSCPLMLSNHLILCLSLLLLPSVFPSIMEMQTSITKAHFP